MSSSIRDQIAYIQCVDSMILIDQLNVETKKCLKRHKLSCNAKNASELLEFLDRRLSSTINVKQIKAIVFAIEESDFACFMDVYKFRLKCREFCESHEIYGYFPNQDTAQAFSGISNSKTLLQNGQKVTVVYTFGNFASLCGTTSFRKTNRYEIAQLHSSKNIEFTEKWKNEFLKNQKPTKVILVRQKFEDSDEKTEKFKELFKAEDCMVLSQINDEYSERSIVEKVLHVMGENPSIYEVANINQNCYAVLIDTAMVFSAVWGEILPFEDSRILKVNEGNIITLFAKLHAGTDVKEVLHYYKLFTPDKHDVKVTLKIDVNAFYEFEVEAVDPKWNDQIEDCIDVFNGSNINEGLIDFQLKNKASLLDGTTVFSKARLIFDKQNFVVFVGDDNKMQVVKDADGLGHKKTPIYIAFIDQKPNVGNVAKDFYNTKPKSVVFDLIKLCSTTNADIMSPKWGFKFEKEEDGTLMVTMDTVDGERKSSVDFLLALILKHGLKIIKTKTGKKFDELEIEFDGFTPNEMLKKNFVEAGKLKKVDIKFC